MTQGRLDRAALFQDPSHLLSLLLNHRPPPAPLPDKVLFAKDRGYAVEAGLLGEEAAAATLARQLGAKVKICPSLEGAWIPTVSLLGLAAWLYRDPLRAADWARDPLDPAAPGMGFFLGTEALRAKEWADIPDPSAPGTRDLTFLLGARDETRAQKILDVLSSHLASGIQAAPVVYEPAPGETLPFRFFWKVFLERLNPFLFEPADRVWWGPIGAGQVKIFYEYPRSLAVPVRHLHRMPWAADTGSVLLSREEPKVLQLLRMPDGRAFPEFLGVVKLEPGKGQVSVPVAATQKTSLHRFRVAIRLGGSDSRDAADRRIEELESELEAKQRLLEHLLARGSQDEGDAGPVQPLFLYAQRDGADVPAEIRRLLVEWADQPEDLGAVAHAFVPGDGLPESLFAAGTNLHVVAAFAALGRDGFDAGARLLDYAPVELNSRHLTLDRRWADFGLRLFSPAGSGCWLYPNLRPGKVSAACLAAAIHQGASADTEKLLYLLLPASDGRLRFLLVPVDAFKPLNAAFDWDLELGKDAVVRATAAAIPADPAKAGILPGRAGQAACASIDDNLARAIEKDAVGRLDTVIARLRKGLAERDKRIDSLAAVEKSVQDALQIFDDVEALLEMKRVFDVSGSQLKPVRAIVERHDALQKRIDALVKNMKALRALWRPEGSSPAGPGMFNGVMKRLQAAWRRLKRW